MTEEQHSLAPPRGMRDFYPEDMARRNVLFDAWRRSAEAFGFQPYDACVVEDLGLLKRKAGEEIVEQLYAFTDKSGRELALRAEMTPTLARMVASRQGSLALPLKWYTVAQCFRYERMTRGRKREHYQWNLDIIGEPSLSAEAEVVATAAHALSSMGLGVTDYRIRYSSRALLSELLAGLHIAPQHHPSVFLALDKRDKVGRDELQALLRDAGLAGSDLAAVEELLSLASMDQVSRVLGSDSPATAGVLDFEDRLGEHGIRELAAFDLSVVRGLAYYTGIVFEAFDTDRAFRAIFGGGRYDNLLSDVGGTPETGVGLGFGDVVVGEVLHHKDLRQDTAAACDLAVGYMTDSERGAAVRFAVAQRKQGVSVDMSLHSEKAKQFFSRAARRACRAAAYVGPDDVGKGSVRVKDLETRTEREVGL